MSAWLRAAFYRLRMLRGYALARTGCTWRAGNMSFRLAGAKHYTRLFRLLDRVPYSGPLSRMLRAPDAPYYLPIHLHTPDDLRAIEQHLTDDVRKHLANGAHLLFDMSCEAMLGDEWLLAFHTDLKRLGVPASRVCLLNANASQSFYGAWAAYHTPDYRIRLVGYHFYLYAIPYKALFSPRFAHTRAMLFKVAQETVTKGVRRPKRYMTLNLKLRPHRVALVLFLLSRGYLKDGIVSYIGEGEPKAAEPPSHLRGLLSQMPGAETILADFAKLETMRPIEYERPAEGVKGIWQKASEIGYIIPELHLFPGEVRIESYFEIVTETYFEDSQTCYITEKTIRPLLRLQPFIHLGAPHVLAELRRLGFRTFSPVIDERYDAIEGPSQRLAAALAEVDRLCSMPPDELHAVYVQLWEVVVHNFNHLCDNFVEIFRKDIEDNVFFPLQKNIDEAVADEPRSPARAAG